MWTDNRSEDQSQKPSSPGQEKKTGKSDSGLGTKSVWGGTACLFDGTQTSVLGGISVYVHRSQHFCALSLFLFTSSVLSCLKLTA